MTIARYRYHARPLKQTMRDDYGKLIGCTDTSFAMLVDATTTGGMTVTERIVRALSNEPLSNLDPLSPGLNLGQIDAVARKLRVEFDVRTGDGWAAIEAASNENRPILAQLWYADLGGSAIGHAVYLEQLRIRNGKQYARIVDPMKGAYEFVEAAKLRTAMKSFATRAGLQQGLLWGSGRSVPWLSANQEPLA